jgi:hypothetical protein
MKYLLITIMSITTAFANTTDISTKLDTKLNPSPVTFEANMFAQSLRSTTSPLVGPTAMYEMGSGISLGARALMSLAGESNESAYAFHLVQRYRVYENKAKVFLELNQGYNQASRTDEFNTLGASLGLKYKISDEISLGGLSGIESDLGTGLLYPKVATFVSINL